MKRRIVALLLVLLVGSWAIPRAQAAEDFTLDGGELGFSLTVPGLPAEEIAVEIQGHTVTLCATGPPRGGAGADCCVCWRWWSPGAAWSPGNTTAGPTPWWPWAGTG